MYTPQLSEFPEFSLHRLLTTCFGTSDETLKACILIDLPDLELMRDLKFLDNDGFQVQKYAKQYFLDPLLEGIAEEVGYSTVDFLAFKTTGGSNLVTKTGLLTSMAKTFPSKKIFARNTTLYLL